MTKLLDDATIEMLRKMRETVFCYAKIGGEGYDKTELCTCYDVESGKRDYCCQAIKDKELFHSLFKGLNMKEIVVSRNKIIEDNKHLFDNSQWFKDNIE